MTSIDGIAELHMSGARAVFVPERGVTISEMDVTQAFEKVGMGVESFGLEERPRAERSYLVDSAVT